MSGLIPKQFIVDLIDRADVVEVVGRRVQLKKAGKEYKACCPFHDEKSPSFTVSPGKGFYHCFGCGEHGNALDFLMQYDHMEFIEAVESLAGLMGVEVPHEEGQGQRPARSYDALFDLVVKVGRFFEAELKSHPPAVDYLKQRGVDGATAKRFSVGYAPSGWSTVLDEGPSPPSRKRRMNAMARALTLNTSRTSGWTARSAYRCRQRVSGSSRPP